MPTFAPSLQVPTLIQPPAAAKPAPAPASTSDALTLDALMQRQKDIAASQASEMQQPIASNAQGMAHLAWALVNGLRSRKAERDLATGQRDVAQAFQTGFDPKTGEMTPEAMGVLASRDPELAAKMAIEAASARRAAAKEGTWVGVPTPQGENGQWYTNTVTGETKKVGGAADTSAWKPSDIAARADDYTKAAGTYTTAAPSWTSMQDAFKTAYGKTGPGVGSADLNMVVGLAKILDPNSVVREGESESVKKTGGAADYLVSYYNQLVGGGTLTDDIRLGIMNTGQSRMKAYYDQAKGQRDWISSVASRHGVDPNDVVPPLAEFGAWADPRDDPNYKPPAETPPEKSGVPETSDDVAPADVAPEATATPGEKAPKKYLDKGGTQAGWDHMPEDDRKLWR